MNRFLILFAALLASTIAHAQQATSTIYQQPTRTAVEISTPSNAWIPIWDQASSTRKSFKISVSELSALVGSGGGVTNGDKGDITVASGVWTVDSGAVSVAEVAGLQAAIDGLQPLDSDLTLIAGLTTTSFGRGLLDDADATAARSTLGLGTAAMSATGDFATASHTHAATDITSGTIASARLPAFESDKFTAWLSSLPTTAPTLVAQWWNDNGVPRYGTPNYTANLIISFGESNSGGRILNTNAVSWETESRPELQIWNFNATAWQALDLGTNNNLDHALVPSAEHAWELGLANRLRRGYFGSRSAYYVQTGQGGSTVSQWNNGGSYWSKFVSRVGGAKSALAGTAYQTHVWVTLGINDAMAGTNDATYKASMQEIISRIKTELPGCKVYLASLPPVNATYIAYSTRLAEIAAEDPNNVRLVSATAPVTLDMQDTNHWSYIGMKGLSARMLEATLGDVGLPGKGLTWTSEDSDFVRFTAVNQFASVPAPVDVTVDGWVAIELGSHTASFVLALDSNTNSQSWSAAGDTYYAAVYSFGTSVFSTTTNANASPVQASGVTTPCWARLRWYAANDDITLETSTDGGSTWVVKRTFTGALAGQTQAFIKALSASNACSAEVWKN